MLDLDPDLGSGIPQQEWEQARQASRANVVRVGQGEWALPAAADRADIIGMIVIEGVLSREIALDDHVSLELLCRGDALLLPTATALGSRLGGGVKLAGLSHARLIVLSSSFIHAAARWPCLLTNLHRRLEAQRQRLAVQGLAAHLPRAEDRLLLTLWLLADSCGRVTPNGTVLPLALTHDVLARLAAARRPTITLALHALERLDCIRRRRDGHLILTDAARDRVNAINRASDSSPALGPSVVLRQFLNETTAQTLPFAQVDSDKQTELSAAAHG
ncbi:MAG: helix-turn-helix domain-containing protein [Solirubrobacteraceae bacterium]